jgi:phosphoenolpyruvate carboxylase
MEIRIVIFLFFVSVAAILNAGILIGLYKLFAGMTAKMADTVSDIQKNSEMREWLQSMQVAAERAALMTNTTKAKFADLDPVFARAQENYRRTLVTIDSKLDETAEKINTAARDVRDVVAKPAFAVATFAAGLTQVLSSDGDE